MNKKQKLDERKATNRRQVNKTAINKAKWQAVEQGVGKLIKGIQAKNKAHTHIHTETRAKRL